MPAWTLEQAKQHLASWLEADAACATGQSYRIGTRSLTRADVSEIAERISFWKREVEKLSSGRRGGARVMRVVPRDL